MISLRLSKIFFIGILIFASSTQPFLVASTEKRLPLVIPECLLFPAYIEGKQDVSVQMQNILSSLSIKKKSINLQKLIRVEKIPEWFRCSDAVESYFLMPSTFILDANQYGVFVDADQDVLVVERSGLTGNYSFFTNRERADSSNEDKIKENCQCK